MDREGVVWVSAVIHFLLCIECAWTLALRWPVRGDCGVVCNIVVYTPIGQMNTKPTRGTIIGIGMLAALWIIAATAFNWRLFERIDELTASKLTVTVTPTNWTTVSFVTKDSPHSRFCDQHSSVDRLIHKYIPECDRFIITIDAYKREGLSMYSEKISFFPTNETQWPPPLNAPFGSGLPVEQQ